ncbi:MAG: FIST C-terminal domain-containing protein [Treponema sp.]|jgi:hypothetical protein|nr:FIST C-terminal domain-containing protein [Treponema sp.]
MIKVFTAFTEEIDDAEAAVSELLQQIEPEHNLLGNSLGIVHCFSDFVDSGVIRALCQKLPFELVGSTTLSLSNLGGSSQLGLILTVLTSDSASFVTGVSSPAGDDVDGPVTELYQRLSAGCAEKPVMLMPFIPFMRTIGGDEFIEKIDSLSGGIPAFGTLAISNEPDFSRSYTIHNGGYYETSLVLAALVGDVDPIFLSASVSDDTIVSQKAVVTGSNRNILQTINDKPAIQYLESIGLAKNGDISGIESMPFILTRPEDGSRLIRACIGGTPEGAVVLCGAAPVNSVLSLAAMSLDDVVESTGDKVTEALKSGRGRGMLMYSCAARYWAQGMQLRAEQEKVSACIGDQAPYHFVYSGGEIFPAFLPSGKVVNQLQNDSLIICIL